MFEKITAKINSIMAKPPKNKALRVGWEMYIMYDYQRVPRSAAALSYYVIIAIFPVLIITARILMGLNITDEQIMTALSLLPEQVIEVVGDFLSYVRGENSTVILIVGIGVMLTSSSAAFRTLLSIFGDIEGKKRFHGILGYLFSFVLSLAFVAAIYLSGVIVLSWDWVKEALTNLTGAVGSGITSSGVWHSLRYVFMFIVASVSFFALYAIAAPRGVKVRYRLPGALTAGGALVGVSAVFSSMISASTKYAIVYGSLASIIILLVFFYACGVVAILGNVLNVALIRVFYGDKQQKNKGFNRS